MDLDSWAKRWCIQDAALADLRQLLGTINSGLNPIDVAMSEAGVQSQIRLEASQKGCRLWRNNVGAAHMQDGSFIRYGLANDSTGVNRTIKSADLIGIRPVKIEQYMVGWILGQFLSREIKKPNWKYTGTDREKGQLQWAQLILSLGGDACFASGIGTI